MGAMGKARTKKGAAEVKPEAEEAAQEAKPEAEEAAKEETKEEAKPEGEEEKPALYWTIKTKKADRWKERREMRKDKKLIRKAEEKAKEAEEDDVSEYDDGKPTEAELKTEEEKKAAE